jgi:hypothetical protein
LLFELEGAWPPDAILERAATARRRFEQILEGEWGMLTVDR